MDYDTIYPVYLNDNDYPDAIVSYWLKPFGASGHCWQPHKSIIVDTDKGCTLVNEEFIPVNYAVDRAWLWKKSERLYMGAITIARSGQWCAISG